MMKDDDSPLINDIVEDLNDLLEEDSDEQLTALELEELLDALDTPGL